MRTRAEPFGAARVASALMTWGVQIKAICLYLR
jgi:hypothetical protein